MRDGQTVNPPADPDCVTHSARIEAALPERSLPLAGRVMRFRMTRASLIFRDQWARKCATQPAIISASIASPLKIQVTDHARDRPPAYPGKFIGGQTRVTKFAQPNALAGGGRAPG